MPILSEHDVFLFVAQLGVIIVAARLFADIAKKLSQPVIVGEVLAGIVLGPLMFGKFFPQGFRYLFPSEGLHTYLLQGMSWLCVLFLLMITGLEIDFRASIRQGKQCVFISLLGLIVSFIGVFSATYLFPAYLFPADVDPMYVRLLATMALTVVAIPVIAKILFDLKILRSEVGVKILTSGILSDVWGWTLLAVLISLIAKGGVTIGSVFKPLLTMGAYLTVTLLYGRAIMDYILKMFGYKKMDSTVALSFLFGSTLLNGALAHLLGIHVVFGAFIAGVMAGESRMITPFMRQWLQDFIFAVFAPIFFVLIGMQLQFARGEMWIPIILFLVVSSVCKIGGAYLGGLWGGLGRKNAFAVACGLNTQGTMGIIIAMIAVEMNVFNHDLFSVIVVICILTSLLIGPLLKWAIKGVQRPLAKYFDREHVFLDIDGKNKDAVIHQMSVLMAQRGLIEDAPMIEAAIKEREETLSTAIGEGVALPHARIKNLKSPIMCFFRTKIAIDFGSHDNLPVRLFFLELTDKNDDGMQLNLITQIARFVASPERRDQLLTCDQDEEIHHILSFDEKV